MLLMTNIDNIASDQVPYIIQSLMEKGACNVHAIPAMTKKGRNEYIFLIDLKKEKVEAITRFMAAETGTIGLRIIEADHISFGYEMRSVRITLNGKGEQAGRGWSGEINVKVVKDNAGGLLSARAEFEEIKSSVTAISKAGLKLTFYELKEMVEHEALRSEREKSFLVNMTVKKITADKGAGD